MSWDDPVSWLREGEIEVMATWVPLGQPDLVVGPTLSRQPRVLAVAHDHPLAGRDTVDVEELADHRVVRYDNWPTELREAAVPSRTPKGRPIHGTAVGVGDRALLGLPVRVARGEFVFPTVESATPYMGELDLAFVPMHRYGATSQRAGVAPPRARPEAARLHPRSARPAQGLGGAQGGFGGAEPRCARGACDRDGAGYGALRARRALRENKDDPAACDGHDRSG